MATAITMKILKEEMETYIKTDPDLIPILTQVGIGTHKAPSGKNRFFKAGEVRVPASALKEEYQGSVLPKEVNIKTIAFIPRHLASDKLLHIVDNIS